jgi:demethylmenaquinone methyltransferase/2-methoxy-6-polyprenyl-1,4-benzoquinol methylase
MTAARNGSGSGAVGNLMGEPPMQSVQRSRTVPSQFARGLFDGLPERYDRLAETLSFGQNRRWRAAMVDALLRAGPEPQNVLDVATGTAGVALMLADRTAATIIGVDLTEQMLRQGQQRVRQRASSDRIALVLGKAEQLPFPDASFDALTFTYLLRYVADPQATLTELTRVLRPGGVMASLEFAIPQNPLIRASWHVYTRAVLPTAGLATGGRAWASVGQFLGPSITHHYRAFPVDWTVQAWHDAGMESVGVRRMSLGGGLVMWGRKRGE